MMESYEIDFEPVGLRGTCDGDRTLLECARQLGVGLVSICGGSGTCGGCKVQITAGRASETTASEREVLAASELDAGYRLACQAYPMADCTVRVPPESLSAPQRTQVEGLEVAVRPDPPVLSYELEISAPSLEDNEADAERLLTALERQHGVAVGRLDMQVLREVPVEARSCKWQVQASVRGEEVVSVGPHGRRSLGLAVDLGTTKVAGYLMDLSSGQVVASHGTMNPQIAYGEDVIARITRAHSSAEEALRLQQLAVSALDELVEHLCAEVGAEREDILEAVVVGNTAMHHLLLNLPVAQLALSPYVPAVRSALDVKARDIGLGIASGAYVHLLPNIAGFVGADHVAMLLATRVFESDGLVLALDIGTNTEVCLVNRGSMSSVSCASGPAFEGAHMKHGMRGADGAIEHLRISGDRVEIQTVGGMPPIGLCGSGIVDAVAHLYLAGAVGANGRMNLEHQGVRGGDGGREFILVSDEQRDGQGAITITQQDVRELQLAKGAIRTGIQLLLDGAGRLEGEIDEVIIAGAFGSYLDPSSAVTIGMFPSLPVSRFRQVGNAAGMGAKLALMSTEQREEAKALSDRVRYIELAAVPEFTRTFAQANYLGLYRISHGRKEDIV